MSVSGWPVTTVVSPPTDDAADAADADDAADAPPGVDVADLFRRHAAGLLRYLARRVDPAVAEDLVGQVFEVVVTAPERYDPHRGTPRAWLFGIATHVLLGHLRSTGRARAATARLATGLHDVDDPSGRVAERVDATRRLRDLAAAIDDLAPENREVLLLTAWTDLTATEIGTALGLPSGTVRSRLHRARADLRLAHLSEETS